MGLEKLGVGVVLKDVGYVASSVLRGEVRSCTYVALRCVWFSIFVKKIC